jgi:hypothetical protein
LVTEHDVILLLARFPYADETEAKRKQKNLFEPSQKGKYLGVGRNARSLFKPGGPDGLYGG